MDGQIDYSKVNDFKLINNDKFDLTIPDLHDFILEYYNGYKSILTEKFVSEFLAFVTKRDIDKTIDIYGSLIASYEDPYPYIPSMFTDKRIAAFDLILSLENYLHFIFISVSQPNISGVYGLPNLFVSMGDDLIQKILKEN